MSKARASAAWLGTDVVVHFHLSCADYVSHTTTFCRKKEEEGRKHQVQTSPDKSRQKFLHVLYGSVRFSQAGQVACRLTKRLLQ